MEIFIHREDGDFGPYTVEELKLHLASGHLRPEDYAWYEGAAEWMALEDVPGVMPPGHQPSPKPIHNTTGLPAWIPPRRADITDSTNTTSFALPAPRPQRAIGITKVPASGSKPGDAGPATKSSAKTLAATKESIHSAPASRVTPVSDAPADRDEEAELIPPQSLGRMGIRNIILGALWFIAGMGATLYAHETGLGQTHGGIYLAALAAIGGGLIQFVRGIIQGRRA